MNVEAIVLIFFSCDKIYTPWNELSLHINKKTSARIGFDMLNVIFGELPFTCQNKMINFVVSSMIQYLFSCLIFNKVPNLLVLFSHLKLKFNVERYAAIKV